MTSLLIPYVQAIRTHFDFAEDAMAWFQLDGESLQNECFQDPDNLDQLLSSHICVGKPAGSTTDITHACDAGAVFKGLKTTNKRISYADVVSNAIMIERLKDVFRDHDAAVTHVTGKQMSQH